MTRSFSFFIPIALLACALATPLAAQNATGPTNILNASDENAYTTAFAAARSGDKNTFEDALDRVTDDTLRAHAERARLISTTFAPDLPAMAAWLNRWGDVAGATDVYDRALEAQEQEIVAARLMGIVATPTRLRKPDLVLARRSMGSVREPSYNPVPVGAGATRADRARIDTLAARFYAGNDEEAFALASQEIDGPQSGQAGWIGGLAAFRMGKFAVAQRYFHLAANWSAGDDWTRSAGAFWASRSAEKQRDETAMGDYLEQAGTSPLTFYGQLALAKLGRWDTVPMPNVADEQDSSARLLRSEPSVRRAAALVEIGRQSDAEAELNAAWNRGKAEDDLGYLNLARALGLDGLASRIAQSSSSASLATVYPVPSNIRPTGGEFVLDRAVVLAVIRQESRFQTSAVSYSGARGLMQLMPRTAAWMTGRRELASNPGLLYDVSLNVTLGEAYLEKLMAEGPISNCLIRTFMAYNAGPGMVGRWAVSIKGGEDPLMFLEGAPGGQARVYTEKVMSNLWIYHRRFGQRAPSLEKLTRGFTPTYEPQDNPRRAIVSVAPIAVALR